MAESGFKPGEVSNKGACGVMQVMPETAALYGVTREELFDVETNIKVELLYLKNLLKTFDRLDLAVAAYNCGPARVVAAGYRIPMIKETQAFVRRVNNAFRSHN